MSYGIELLPAARRQLRKLPQPAQEQIRSLIDALKQDPRPAGCKALKGDLKGFYRVRTGDYRVIYAIRDDVLLILVVKIADRREAY
jgi:mRNA interferase RelE/StbE